MCAERWRAVRQILPRRVSGARRVRPAVNALPLAALALVLAAGAASAQPREVVAKQIAVSRNEATLRLEFAAGEALEVSFQDGGVLVNGEALGTAGHSLEAAWRGLLSELVTLEDEELVRALLGWSPPADLEGADREVAARLDGALETAAGGAQAAPSPQAVEEALQGRRTLAALLSRPGRLPELAAALAGLTPGDVRLHVGESAEVAAGEEVRATVVIVDGDLVVRGRVAGDVVAVGGTVRLPSGGRIDGRVRLADARLQRDGGEVAGEVREVEAAAAPAAAAPDRTTQERMRQEILRELRAELGNGARARSPGRGGFLAPVRHVVRGVGGVLSTLLTILVLSVVGGAVVHFAQGNLEVVAETARRAPARAAAVGLAGAFLALPVWVLGAVALVVSLIGIPVALVWLPLFPVALALAVILGYYAVAHNVGAWIAGQRYPYLEWVRLSNPFTLIAAGVLGLMAAFLVAQVLEIGGPWLGFLKGLFIAAGVVVTVAAKLIGFGAVLITRGGRRPEYYPGGDFFDGGWGADPGDSPDRGPRGGGWGGTSSPETRAADRHPAEDPGAGAAGAGAAGAGAAGAGEAGTGAGTGTDRDTSSGEAP